MSVVIFGQRSYGRVLSHGGERAETVFFHVQFMPLIPLHSQWVTSEDGAAQKTGFATKLNLRSVAAGYLRWWGLVGGVVAAASGSAAGGIAGAVLLLASLWSWSWLWRFGTRAQRRSELDRMAFGHRCDPSLLIDEERARITRALSDRLAQRADPRPPDDIARFGARDLQEAITAYGLLRLNSQHREARAAADQLLSHAFESMPSEGGPFRAAATADVPDASRAIAEAIQAEIAAEAGRRKQRLARRPKRWYQRPTVQVLALGVGSLSAFGSTVAFVGPAHHLTDDELDGVMSIPGRVSVACDAPPTPYLRGGDQVVSLCPVGKHVLAVMQADPASIPETTLQGHLKRVSGYQRHHAGWIEQLESDRPVADHAYGFFLEQEAPSTYWTGALLVIVADALLLFGWAMWVRTRLRRRAARRAGVAAA